MKYGGPITATASARRRRVSGEGDRVRRRLGAAVRGHQNAATESLEPELEPAPALLDGEEHGLAVRPEREHAVQPGTGEEVRIRRERGLVEPCAAISQRRRGGRDRPVQTRRQFSGRPSCTRSTDVAAVPSLAGLDGRPGAAEGHLAVERHAEHRGGLLHRPSCTVKRLAPIGRHLRLCVVGALRIERDGDVLRVTLARPATRNAFDAALITELSEAFVDVGAARAVVLAGTAELLRGRDVEWMRASADLGLEANVADANAMRRMFEAVDACPAPVVAVVQGHALGGGIGLVACSDIVLAEPHAVFAFSEKLGIIPAVISPFAIRKIGESAARRYSRHGERFDAATALRIGLVHGRGRLAGGLGECLRAQDGGPRRTAREAARPRPTRRPRDSPQDRGAADERRGARGAARVPRAATPLLGT